MRTARLIFSSVRTDTKPTTVASILRVSRMNNPRDGVTGALISGEHRFLQLLEGDPAGLERCFARIRRDVRHRDLAVLAYEATDEILFPNTAMQSDEVKDMDPRMAALSPEASPAEIMDAFASLAQRSNPSPAPELGGALAVLWRIHGAARHILDDHLNGGRSSPETLARLGQSLARQVRHARELHQRLAAAASEGPEHIQEALRLRNLLEDAEREVARRLNPPG